MAGTTEPPATLPLLGRRALATGVAGGMAAVLTGRSSLAADGTLVVANWGGDWNERTVHFVEAPFSERTGIRIVRELNMEPERKTKLVAERRLRRGTVDVVHLNDSDAFEMSTQDVLADLDPARIPNLASTVPALRRPYFLPWLYSGVVLLHNPARVPDPPRSYADLWDAKWAGRLGLTNQLYFNYMMMAGLVRGGSMTNADAGKDRLLELKSVVKPRIYATHQLLAAALANGEVDVAVNYKARGLQWARDGIQVQVTYPAEGAIAITFGATMPRRAANPDAAYAYLDAMLDPSAMAGLAGASFYAAANTKAVLPPELKSAIDFSPDEQARLRFPDYAYVAKNTSEWLEWWGKAITS